MLSETERAYLAGFFDGDGCVNIGTRQGKHHSTPSHYLQVIFSQCDELFLLRWRDKVGMGSVHANTPLRSPGINQTKVLYHWRLNDRQAQAMLLMMIDYLDIKKSQAEVALRFMDTKGHVGGPHMTSLGMLELRDHYKEQLHQLKKTGGKSIAELQAFEQIADSQLCLFEVENI